MQRGSFRPKWMAKLRRTPFVLLLLCAAAGCVQTIGIDVLPRPNKPPNTSSEIDLASRVVATVAADFGFERHTEKEYYKSQRNDLEIIAVYFNTGSKGFGEITMSLWYWTEEGHLEASITDFSAYGPTSPFVNSLKEALASSLAKHFPDDHIEVDSTRGVSPLGP